LLRVLLPASTLMMIASQVGAVLLAYDRFDIQFWCTAGLSLGRVLVVFIAPWTGLTSMIYGLGGVSLLYSGAILLCSRASTGCALLPLLRGLVGPGISSVFAAVLCLLAIYAYPPSPMLTISSLALGALAFVISMLVIDRKSLIEDWHAVRRLAAHPDKPDKETGRD
jgi:hypothetical protein